jgi:microtubule-associated protein-like 6
MAERKVPAKLKETRPPLWSSKVHGVPNRYTPSIKLPEREPGTALVAVNGGGAVGAPSAGGALSARGETRVGAPLAQTAAALNEKIQAIEVDLRRNLRELAAMSKLHETEKSILIRTFECFDYDRTGKVSREGCRKALRSLGVQVDEYEVARIFDKYGQDMSRMMPYDVFTSRLFLSANRVLAWTEQRHEAFKGGDTKDELAFNGKIIYPKGKLGSVYTPADWDPAMAERAKLPPDAMLELEYVYGYRADDNVFSPNLFYTSNKELAYFTAGVGIIYNKEASSQRFFLGHTDDILCLALDPTRTICATGQRKPIGARPYVCVWDVNSMQELVRLEHKTHDGDPAILAVQFSRDGSLLVAVQKNIDHTITIWDWRTATVLLEEKTQKGPAPMGIPMIFGVAWNMFARPDLEAEAAAFDFALYGVKGLTFWKLPKKVEDGVVKFSKVKLGKGGAHTTTQGTGDIPSISHHNIAVWLPNGDCISGTKTGELWLWRDSKFKLMLSAHKGEVTALTLRADGLRLLSASSSGTIIEWNVEGDAPVSLSRRTIPPQFSDAKPPGIKALDCFPGSDIYVMGSMTSDIYEVRARPRSAPPTR